MKMRERAGHRKTEKDRADNPKMSGDNAPKRRRPLKGTGKMRILFMGTPDFAVPVLRYLMETHTLVCVVTKPDKPKGRGKQLAAPPVKELATAAGIPVLQPESVRTEAFCDALRAYDAELFVTAAYGKILPPEVLRIPPRGCVNVHASLLPKYRGAAPIWHCVINGEAETGITTMMTDAGMDTGDILMADRVPIGENMTMGELHDVLAELGVVTLDRTLKAMESGTLTRTPQDHALATYAPMVERETGHINWSASARQIHDLVRGTNPFPVSYTFWGEKRLKIWKTMVLKESAEEEARPGSPAAAACAEAASSAALHAAEPAQRGNVRRGTAQPGTVPPGTVLRADGNGIDVAAGSGVVRILELQGESSKRMSAGAFLNGLRELPTHFV